MIGPTLMAWASDKDKPDFCRRWPAVRKSGASCSRNLPEALTSRFRTRAERDGDDWVINGQKIWTSGAHYSDYGVIVVRTDPTVPKHKGLSYFYIDMKAPGVEIKPIKQLTGDSDFNEVYFTDVRVSDSQRLGEVGQGCRCRSPR